MYDVPCMNCEGMSVGETRRCLGKNHGAQNGSQKGGGGSTNGITVHVLNNDHKID